MFLKGITWLVESKFLLVFILIVLYVICWLLQGFKGLKFDMQEFRQFIGWVSLYVAALHGIDSGLNTPIPWKGANNSQQQLPKAKEENQQ